MDEKTFMTVDDVAKEMSVSKSYAYKVVRLATTNYMMQQI